MPDPVLSFFVDGWARPQGSKKASSDVGTSKVWLRESSDPSLRWRAAVEKSAHGAARRAGLREPIDYPVRLGAYFFFAEPKTPKDPDWPIFNGDIEKLVRSVNDALQDVSRDGLRAAGVLTDDALVVGLLETWKLWARGDQRPGVWMWLERAEHPQWYAEGKVWE